MNTPVRTEIKWLDAACSHGWGTLEEKLSDTTNRALVLTIGYLVHVDDTGLYAAESVTEAESLGCVNFIPWGMVREVRRLSPNQPLTDPNEIRKMVEGVNA